jgi:hypothetical protein
MLVKMYFVCVCVCVLERKDVSRSLGGGGGVVEYVCDQNLPLF